MSSRLLASLASLVLGAGTVLAQLPPPTPEKPQLPPPTPEKSQLPPPKLEKKDGKTDKAAAEKAGAGMGNLFNNGSWVPWPEEGSWWTSGEFLIFWTNRTREFPPLVTDGPQFDEFGNILGNFVLVGNGRMDYNEFAGLRLRGGYWFDAERDLGLEQSLLILGKRSLGWRSDSLPTLGRPYFDFATRAEATVLVAEAGIAAGGMSFRTTSRTWGLESNVWKKLYYDPVFNCARLDLICGLRYLDLAEDIRMDRSTSYNPDLSEQPRYIDFQSNRILESEGIRTHNHFYGAQAGLSAKFFGEYCVIDLTGKIAMGVNQETVHISGEQLRIQPDGTRTLSQGALLALPTNIGKHRREQFSYIPELYVNVGIPLNNHVGIYLGYNCIYWSKVARPADQIDRVVDAALIPNLPPPVPGITGLDRPSVPFTQSHWWAQGFSFGIEFSW